VVTLDTDNSTSLWAQVGWVCILLVMLIVIAYIAVVGHAMTISLQAVSPIGQIRNFQTMATHVTMVESNGFLHTMIRLYPFYVQIYTTQVKRRFSKTNSYTKVAFFPINTFIIRTLGLIDPHV
jgi:hypothetical protein